MMLKNEKRKMEDCMNLRKEDSAWKFKYFILIFSIISIILLSNFASAVITTLVPINNVTGNVTSGALTENSLTFSTQALITDVCYPQINISGGSVCLEDEGSVNKDAYFVWNITLNFTYASINNVTLKSIAANTVGNDFLNISLYNFTSGAFKDVNNSITIRTAGTNVTLTFIIDISGEITNFIGSGTSEVISFMSHTAGPSADDINQDYFEAVVNYVPDTTPPNVTIVNPLNQTYTTSIIPFNFTLNEAGSCNYTLTTGTTNITMTANSSNTGFNATNSSVPDGQYTARAYCQDNAGNTNLTESVVFSVDTTPPNVTNVVITPQKILNGTAVNVSATVKDRASVSFVKALIYYPNGTNFQNITMANGGSGSAYSNTTYTISFTPAGTYNVTIFANDTFNNINNTEKSFYTPYLNLSNFTTITIDGGFTDWAGIPNVTDIVGDGNITTFKANFTSISIGDAFTCAIITNGSAYCWGTGGSGQLGYGGATEQDNPIAVNMTRISPQNFTSISAGGAHTCSIITNGSAYCWGLGSNGQLGYGGTTDQNNPIAVNMTGISPQNFTSISAGNGHTCGIITNGSAYCWGTGTFGRLGYGGLSNQNNPIAVNMTGISPQNFTSISAGNGHTCSIITNGSAYCWGLGSNGQLGYGGTTQQNNSIAVNMTGISPQNFTSISAESIHTCGIITNGSAYCWGNGTNGELGYGGTTDQNNPIAVNMTGISPQNFTSISARFTGSHTCAIITNGSAYCWGTGTFGRLGYGDTTQQNIPIAVNMTGISPQNFTSISAGSTHTCSIITNGSAYCWGAGISGQLGDGSVSNQNNPIAVNQTGLNSTAINSTSYDIATISISNNASQLFVFINTQAALDFSDTSKVYRVYVTNNETAGNGTTPELNSLAINYTFRIQSFNATLWQIFNVSGANTANATSASAVSNNVEISISLSSLNITTGDSVNTTFETASSTQSFDFAPDYRSFLLYKVASGGGGGGGANVTLLNISQTISYNVDLSKLGIFARISFLSERLIDALIRLLYALRGIFQIVDLNDFIARFITIPRSISQIVDLNDAVARFITIPRLILQVVDLNDAVFRTFIGTRGVFQIVDLNDAVFKIFGALRGIFQIVDLNDAANVILSKLVSIFQIVDLNDSVSRLFKGFRNIFEVVDLNDAVFRLFVGTRNAFQVVDLNDAVSRIFLGFRNAFQVVDLNDSVSRLFNGFRNIFEVVDLNEAVFRVFVGLRSLFQLVDLNDAVARFITIPRFIAQVVDLNDAVARVFIGLRNVFQVVDINDAVFRLFVGTRSVFQLVDLNDAVFRIFSGLRNVFQIVDLNDAAFKVFATARNLFQIVDLNDGITNIFGSLRSVFQLVDLNDTVSRIFNGFRNIFEVVDLNEAVFRVFVGFRGIFQIVDLNDAVFKIYATLRNTFQVVDINEAVARIFIGLRNVFQIIDINDAIFRIFSGFRNVFQNFQIITATNASVTQGVQSLTRDVFQVVDINDAIFRTFLGLRGIAQILDVNDAVFRIFIGIRGVFQIVDINDAVFKIFGSLRNIFQIIDLNDSVAKIFGSLRSVFQVVDVNDSMSRIFFGFRNIFQTFTLNTLLQTATPGRQAVYIAQSITLNNLVTRIFAGFKGIFQVVDINDAVFRYLTIPRAISQIVDLTDFVSKYLTIQRAISQIVDLNDAFARTFLGLRSIAQIVDINEAVSRIFIGFRNIFQVVDINDVVFKVFGSLRNIFQIVDLNDAVASIFIGLRGLFQIVDLNDAVSRLFIGLRGVFQVVDSTDSVSKVFGTLRNVFQIVDLNDAVFRIFKPIRYVAQSININTATSRLILIFRIMYQQLSINAVTGRFIGIPRNVNQGFSIFNGATTASFNVFIVNVYQSINVNTAVNRIAFFLRNIFDRVLNNILCIVNGSNCVAAPSPSPSPSPSESPPSGGGTLGRKVVKSFYTDKEEIDVRLNPNGVAKAFLSITNNGSEKLNFVIRMEGLKEYLTESPRVFSLAPNETGDIDLIITAPAEPGIYTSTIVIDADGVVKKIPIVIEVESAEKLFDVVVDIPVKYQEIRAGDDIVFTIDIINLGDKGVVDVVLDYFLKDFENNVILKYSETLSVETRTSIIREISIPSNLPPGKYVLVAQVSYKNAVATGTSILTIKEKFDINRIIVLIILITIIIIISFLVENLYKTIKQVRYKKRKNELKEELNKKGISLSRIRLNK